MVDRPRGALNDRHRSAIVLLQSDAESTLFIRCESARPWAISRGQGPHVGTRSASSRFCFYEEAKLSNVTSLQTVVRDESSPWRDYSISMGGPRGVDAHRRQRAPTSSGLANGHVLRVTWLIMPEPLRPCHCSPGPAIQVCLAEAGALDDSRSRAYIKTCVDALTGLQGSWKEAAGGQSGRDGRTCGLWQGVARPMDNLGVGRRARVGCEPALIASQLLARETGHGAPPASLHPHKVFQYEHKILDIWRLVSRLVRVAKALPSHEALTQPGGGMRESRAPVQPRRSARRARPREGTGPRLRRANLVGSRMNHFASHLSVIISRPVGWKQHV